MKKTPFRTQVKTKPKKKFNKKKSQRKITKAPKENEVGVEELPESEGSEKKFNQAHVWVDGIPRGTSHGVYFGVDGIKRDSPPRWYMECSVEGIPQRWLVDTGCPATIMSWWEFHRLDTEVQQRLRDTKKVFSGVTGMELRVRGQLDTRIKFPDDEVKVTVIVADISLPGIVGMDLLSAMGAKVCLSSGRLTANGTEMVLLDRPRMSGTNVTALHDVVIPPYSERVVSLILEKTAGKSLPKEGEFCPDVNQLENLELFTTGGIVRRENQRVSVSLINKTEKYKRVPAGTSLGVVDGIEECIDIDLESRVKTPRDPKKRKSLSVTEVRQFEDVPDYDKKNLNYDKKNPKNPLSKERKTYGLPEYLQGMMHSLDQSVTKDQRNRIAQLILEYKDIFVEPEGQLGSTSVIRHRIDTGNAAPIKQPLRRVPYKQHEIIETEVEKMKKAGVIEDSTSPWSSPVVLVKKKDGTTRFCIDYRKLNQVTRMDAYPLPRIDESFDTLGGSQYFSTLDLASGYWQVEMDPKDKAKTAFSTRTGLYEFKVMPFGLSTAPATFERLMEIVMRGLQWKSCLVYLDDVICIGKTFEEALKNIRAVFERLRRAGLKIKPSKCELLKSQVKFLGHIVTREGLRCDPQKLEAVRNYDIPKNVTDVRAFLGFVGYYRRFIKDFSTIAVPLNELLHKDQKFYWGEQQQEAFDRLREPLMREPLLIYPDMKEEFILDTDASGFGLGGVLSQVRDGQERVVAYASFGLRPTQRNYCTTKRELLAVVSMIHHFRHYLWGRKFKLRTDHASLRWLINFRDAEGMVARWMARIASYNYELEVREGKKHANADGMSRCRQCKRDGCPADGKSKREINYESDEDLLPEISGENWREEIALTSELPLLYDWTEDLFCGDDLDMICNIYEEEVSYPESLRYGDKETRDSKKEVVAYGLRKKQEPSQEKDPTPKEGGDNWLTRVSLEDLRKSQVEDPDLRNIIEWKKSLQKRPQWKEIREKSQAVKSLWQIWDQLFVTDGILKREKILNGKKEPVLQVVVPLKMRNEIFQELHAGRMSGHLGINRTIERIRNKLYWPGIKADVKRWSVKCLRCEARKPKSGPKRYPMGQIAAGAPFERVAMDILEPGEISQNGNRYIIVISDYFTKWTEAYAVKDHTAFTVAETLVTEFICRFGVPKVIHTDQGTEFQSALFQQLCELLQCKKTRTTPYHPQSDGLVERQNRTILAMLSAVVNENLDDWDDHLPYVMSAYRSSVQESTGCTPNLMLFGRENTMPLDLIFPLTEDEYPECSHEYVQWVRQAQNIAHEYAREKLKTSALRQRRNYDLRSMKREYKKGTWVWYFYPPAGRKKLGLGWKGPFLVIDDRLERAVKIQLNPKTEPKIVHIDNLKKFHGDPPQEIWIEIEEDENPEQDSRKGGETLSSEIIPDKDEENNEDLENFERDKNFEREIENNTVPGETVFKNREEEPGSEADEEYFSAQEGSSDDDDDDPFRLDDDPHQKQFLKELEKSDLRKSALRQSALRQSDLRTSDLRTSALRPSALRPSALRTSDLRTSDLRTTNLRQEMKLRKEYYQPSSPSAQEAELEKPPVSDSEEQKGSEEDPENKIWDPGEDHTDKRVSRRKRKPPDRYGWD